jgi:hypothetical protein
MQVKLYEDFARSQAKQEVDEVIEGEGAENKPAPPQTHIFQVMVHVCVCVLLCLCCLRTSMVKGSSL